MLYSYYGTLCSNENLKTHHPHIKHGDSHKHNGEQKKPDPKRFTFYESIYIKVKNRQDESINIEVRSLWERDTGETTGVLVIKKMFM